MSILRHEGIGADVLSAYLSLSGKRRRQGDEENEAVEAADDPASDAADFDEAEGAVISEEEYADLAQREQFVLSVTEKGFGSRVSAYRYRVTGRGGLGIENMRLRNGDAVVAVFPIGHNDQIMLVTDAGMVIRVPVHDIRIVSRAKQGVTVFKVGDGERVVSVARLPEVAPEVAPEVDDENGNGNSDSGAVDEQPDAI
jgi:DNA gyrase subunit A